MSVISTDYYRQQAAKAEAGQAALPVVAKVSYGDGGLEADNVTPRNLLTSDNALVHKLVTVNVESISYPIPTTVRFTSRLTFTEPNTLGKNISEMSLEDAAGNLLAIKTFAPIPKNAESEFVVDWDEAY